MERKKGYTNWGTYNVYHRINNLKVRILTKVKRAREYGNK